jgi:hypothetical protein
MSKSDDDVSMAGLSPEEIAALNGDEGDTNDDDADDVGSNDTDADAGDGDGDGDDAADADEGGDDNADGDDGAAAAAAGTVDDTKDEDAGETIEARPFSGELAVNLVENFDQKIADIKDKKAALRKQLDEGEIEMSAYEAQVDELTEEATALRIQQSTAENNAKQNEHLAIERWKWEQEQFFGQEANKIYDDKYLGAALNEAVKDLANDPKNASRSGPWFLAEADKMIRSRFNIQATPVDDGGENKGGKDGKGGKENKGRKPDLTNIPKTLGGLPAAESIETGGGEFAYLDKLEGMELEAELAKMPKEKADRYLRAAA